MIPRKNILPFARPDISDQEIELVKKVLYSGWLTTGKYTEDLEKRVKEYCNARYAIAVNSATAGLHLCLRALDVKEGEGVIVPAFTFTATASVVFWCKATPILVDVDRETYLLTEEILEKFINKECYIKNQKIFHKKTDVLIRGIICVHYGGRVCDIDSLKNFARKYDLFLGEDAAHAFGSKYKNQNIGSLTDFTVFSFYATKNITTGEGGMITTNSDIIAQKVHVMRLHGFDTITYKRKNQFYNIISEGYKYNIPDILSAIGLAQFERHEGMLSKRKMIHDEYHRALKDLSKIKINPNYEGSSYHLYTIETNYRDIFMQKLLEYGIQTSIHFIPLYRMTYYINQKIYNIKDFPNTEEIFSRIFSLPIYSAMNSEDVLDVIQAVQLVYQDLHLKRNQMNIDLPYPLSM